MDEFYVNCVLKGDVNISCVKITKKYFDDNLKSCLSFFPLPVVKITSGCNSCYAQLRVASSLYKKDFENYLKCDAEKRIFECSEFGGPPILFISQHYRSLLGIDINQVVENDNDVQYNIKPLTITPPKNLFMYFFYIIRAAYDHPEIYSFFMFLITLFGLTLAALSCQISIKFVPILISSIIMFIGALIISTKYIGFGISLFLVWLATVLLFVQQYLPANTCGG